MYDYSYSSSSSIDAGAVGGILAVILGFGLVIWLITMAIAVLIIIAQWKIFTKAGREGWKVLIPFYNLWTAFEIAGMHGALSLLNLVPIAGIVVDIMYIFKLAKAFGKDTAFGFGLLFLSPIFMLILAFSKSIQYVGDGGAAAPAAAPVAPIAQDPWVSGQPAAPTAPADPSAPQNPQAPQA